MSGEVVGKFGGGVASWVNDGSGSMASDDVVCDGKMCATEDKRIVCISARKVFCDDIFDIGRGAVWVFDGGDEVIGREIGDDACEVVSREEVFVDA